MNNTHNESKNPINENNIFVVASDAKNFEDVITQLSNELLKKETVKSGYVNAVLAREKEYPTGIPVSVPVALPHTDAEYCLKPAIIVGKLAQPVPFGMMGGEADEVVDVRLVFMLSLPDPKNQIETIKNLTEMFRKDSVLENILQTQSLDGIKNIIAQNFS